MTGGLHRRTSSAALHYSSLLPANQDQNHQGQDISLYTSSASASSSTRSQGSKPHSAVSVPIHQQESLQEEMEEKEGLLGQGGPSPRIHPSITVISNGRNKKRRSKCRILFLLMVLSSAVILLYALVTGWIAKRDVEKVWGNWKDWQKENWGTSTSTSSTGSTTLNSTVESLNSTDASSIQALLASKGRPASIKSNVSSIVSADLPSSTSFRSSSKLFNDDDNTDSKSNMTHGSFSYAQIKEANEMVDQGNFSVYKWHETLPSLKTSTSYASKKKEAGRSIVVGDLHGSHHSLFHLLRRISYTPSHDTLLHTGDITSKSTLHNSLATLTLLRKLGSKGVRGNHDQKVLEWRKWMQHLGPLNQTQTQSENENEIGQVGVVPGVHSTIGREQKRLEGIEQAARRIGTASKAYEESLRRDREEEEEYRMSKMRSMKPREEKLRKRDWRSWLGTGTETEDTSEEEVLETAESQGEGEPTDEAYQEEEEQESITSSSSFESESYSSTQAKATDRRRPFGQRPSRLPSSSSSTSSSAIARPTSLTSSPSSKSAPVNTALLGPLWAHLDPSLSGSERNRLGLKTPTGWEWGDEHFELARSMSEKDVDYLEGLPLTLWVQELNSFIVHAGLVPWTETPTSAFSPLPSTLSTSRLISTSSMTFTPPSSYSESLSSSLQGSLYLTPQNTDPFTLLSMRTLSLVHPSSHSEAKVKGPPSEWRVSSKSKKAGRNSRPWWSVWEDSMTSYEEIEDEGAESVGVIYGHWAAQGLEVQKHSIGLDSGCVYGRQLSALVLDLSDNLSPASPLSDTTDSSPVSSSSSGSSSSSKGYTAPLDSTRYKSSVEKTLKSETGERLSKSRPNWGSDKSGMERISKSSSVSPPADSSSISSISSDSSTTNSEEDDSTLPEDLVEVGEKPWWKPWKRSSSSEDAEGDEEESFIELDEEKKRLVKRAPPQFRPMGGLDEEKILAAASASAENENENEEEEEVEEEVESETSEVEPSTTTRRTRPTRPTRISPSSSSSLTPSSASTTHRHLKSPKTTSFPAAATPTKSLNLLSTTTSTDDDDEDDDEELPVLKSETEQSEGEDFKGDSEDLFNAKRIEYKPLKGKSAWIVQVDCGVEVGMGEE